MCERESKRESMCDIQKAFYCLYSMWTCSTALCTRSCLALKLHCVCVVCIVLYCTPIDVSSPLLEEQLRPLKYCLLQKHLLQLGCCVEQETFVLRWWGRGFKHSRCPILAHSGLYQSQLLVQKMVPQQTCS